MTMEESGAPVAASSAAPHVQGQNASGPGQQPGQGAYRRRRRRRKNKGAAQQKTQPGAVQGQPQQSPSAGEQQPQQPQQPRQPRQPRQGQTWQKQNRFHQKNNNGHTHQPGNTTGSFNGGSKQRKPKQRRQQVFVGPMDHSYRIVNGNIADSPPATIHMANGNTHGGYPTEIYSSPSIAVREDAPTRIYCFIEDLFFLAKIQEVSKKLGVKVCFVKGDKEGLARILEATDQDRAALVVLDLNNANAKPLTIIPKIKSKLKRGVSVVGFLSHLQGDLKMKAMEAGCDTVMPRSAFSQSLPSLLRRYGVEEEEEQDMQPVF